MTAGIARRRPRPRHVPPELWDRTGLLLRAALSADPESWTAWRAQVPELRGLEPLEGRLVDLAWVRVRGSGATDPWADRLDGVLRRNWAAGQKDLQGLAPLGRQLDARHIPWALVGDGAVVALGEDPPGTRRIRTLDVMVPADAAEGTRGLVEASRQPDGPRVVVHPSDGEITWPSLGNADLRVIPRSERFSIDLRLSLRAGPPVVLDGLHWATEALALDAVEQGSVDRALSELDSVERALMGRHLRMLLRITPDLPLATRLGAQLQGSTVGWAVLDQIDADFVRDRRVLYGREWRLALAAMSAGPLRRARQVRWAAAHWAAARVR